MKKPIFILLVIVMLTPLALAQESCQGLDELIKVQHKQTRDSLNDQMDDRFNQFETDTESFVMAQSQNLITAYNDSTRRGVIIFSVALLGLSLFVQFLVALVRIRKERALFLALNDHLIKMSEHLRRRM